MSNGQLENIMKRNEAKNRAFLSTTLWNLNVDYDTPETNTRQIQYVLRTLGNAKRLLVINRPSFFNAVFLQVGERAYKTLPLVIVILVYHAQDCHVGRWAAWDA